MRTICLRWHDGVRIVPCNEFQRLNTLRMYRTWRAWKDRPGARDECLAEAEQFRY
jgi:hypothetical protein